MPGRRVSRLTPAEPLHATMKLGMSSLPHDRTPAPRSTYPRPTGGASSSREVRRRLLSGVVDHNLETLYDEPRGSRRRDRERSLRRRRTLAAVAVTAALVVAAGSAALVARSRHSGPPTATPAAPPPMAADGPPADPESVAGRLARQREQGLPATLLAESVPLAVRRIAIDPGHGGVDGGASVAQDMLEKDLTRDIAVRLAGVLTAGGTEVVLTRHGDDAVPLPERAAIANRARADLFVSIHVNWLPDRSARGIEVYYLGATDDPFLRRLAATENAGSGYTVADYRRLLEGILADVRQSESRRLATALSDALYTTLRHDNPSIVARGVMSAPFVVLVATEMPAVLAEVACLSNDREARLLARPSYRQRIAEALAAGIDRYTTPTGQTGEGAGS